ncbi:MAG: GNAT family N-acetyltransferase [Candidatus Heimdallarchaeota archaeon]|nr:GNAT family N-acetyltransferase [Candidatus Heimdallarchaeota archaeon]
MMDNCTIRELDKQSQEDWAFFDALQLDSFKASLLDGDKLSEKELLEKYKKLEEEVPIDYHSPNQKMYILETTEGEKAGLIWFCDREPFWRFKTQHVWIYNLNVLPKFRRKGLASKLMNLAEEYAKKEGLDAIALHVVEFNTRARKLYEKLGYRLVATHNESCFYEKKI